MGTYSTQGDRFVEKNNSSGGREIQPEKIDQNQPPYIIGEYTVAFHFHKEHRELNHLDLFLRPPNYDYLITYKLPKNKNDNRGILQKNHRTKYLSYEGPIRNHQEKIRIITRGIFIAHPWIVSGHLQDFIHILWHKVPDQFIRENMWKKTNFKIDIDQIKLYEIIDSSAYIKTLERPDETERISEARKGDLRPILPSSPPPVPLRETPSLEGINAPAPAMPNPPLQQSEPMQKEAPPKPVQINVPQNKFTSDENIDLVPIQELILEESGKSTETYNPDL